MNNKISQSPLGKFLEMRSFNKPVSKPTGPEEQQVVPLAKPVEATKAQTSSSQNNGNETNKMLVLSRRPGQYIILDDNGKRTVIEVGDINGQQVSLGIDAPKEVSVDRAEIRKSKEKSKQ